MNLTRDQIVRYWQTRLAGQRVNWGSDKSFRWMSPP